MNDVRKRLLRRTKKELLRLAEELDLGFTDRARKADIVDAILETAEVDR